MREERKMALTKKKAKKLKNETANRNIKAREEGRKKGDNVKTEMKLEKK
jgi:hypothetical protein